MGHSYVNPEMATVAFTAFNNTLAAMLGFIDASKLAAGVEAYTVHVTEINNTRVEVIVNSDLPAAEKDELLRRVAEDQLKAERQSTENIRWYQSQMFVLFCGGIMTGGLNLPIYGIRKGIENRRLKKAA